MKMILRFLLLTLISINCFTYAETANDASCQKIFNHFSKDDQYVYYRGIRLFSADPKTFEVIKNSDYSKDANFVYYETIRIADADPDTFELINNGQSHPLAKDKNRVYLDGKVIESANPKYFKHIKEGFYKDDRSVFYQGFKLAHSDPESFLVYGNRFGRDSLRFYTISFGLHSRIPLIFSYLFSDLSIKTPSQLEFLEMSYFKNHQNFYFFRTDEFTLLNIPNSNKFHYISNHYFHDGTRVYFNKQFNTDIITLDADLKTFKKIGINDRGFSVFQDKYGCFIRGQRTKNCSIIKLEKNKPTTNNYRSYNNTNYQEDINANCNQKQLINNDQHYQISYKNKDYFASMKYVYYQGSIIEYADPVTFEYVGSIELYMFRQDFFRDKKAIYLDGKVVKGIIDTKSFVLLSDSRGADKNQIFSWNTLGILKHSEKWSDDPDLNKRLEMLRKK